MITFEQLAEDLIKKPQTIAIIADPNSGKSMLNCLLLEHYKKNYNFNICTFGMRVPIEGATEIHTVEEVEKCERELVNLDEFENLIDLEDRHQRREIEKTFRLINHKNNILALIGLPRNFNKFVSASVDKFIFLSCDHSDFINGSTAKRILTNYKGYENGSTRLSLDKGQALYFDGEHYHMFNFGYNPVYDTKLANKPIFEKKIVDKSVGNIVPKNVEKAFTKKCGDKK